MRVQIIGQQVFVVGRPDSFMSGACASQSRSVVIAGGAFGRLRSLREQVPLQDVHVFRLER